jgi:glycosyltransferase involved in cell wall biosynthesis
MPMARQAHEVRAAVMSVLGQDYGDFELLIGDETGAAESLVAEIGDPRVQYRHNPTRLGFAQNHIALLDRARGRYMAVLHDDDRWEPGFLSELVAVLDGQPEIGLACCGVVLDRGSGQESGELWPIALHPGRNDAMLDVLLREEWFMLQGNAVWRRELWAGAAREWPELCCADLQFFLSVADAQWPVYFVDRVLMTYSMHVGQSGAWRGADSGLAVADDVLAFWERWLRGRPEKEVALTAGQRARWQLRRARALVLAGRTGEARRAVAAAQAFGVAELPGLGRLKLAVAVPNPVARGAVALKRALSGLGSTSAPRARAGRADGSGPADRR